eukprot:m.13108 g.13108  ORF g.13108 m.13108 type:complete len:512 (+) comp8292_c0_seq1:34-1569(+)
MVVCVRALVSLVVLVVVVVGPCPSVASLFPLPTQSQFGSDTATLATSYKYFCAAGGACSSILQNAFTRYEALIPAASSKTSTDADLSECSFYVESSDESLNRETDESYKLTVHTADCYVHAATVYGALHALETLSQLYVGRTIPNVPAEIIDRPRFAFRALMIDTSRHYLPPAFIKHIVTAMSQNKLNILHWHIVDEQSFPCQSETYPLLSEKGAWAPKAIYSPAVMSEIVSYAKERGVRVMIEFDVPGHGSWGKGIPSLMGCDVVLDPTQNTTYEFLVNFLNEMGNYFPDEFLFLGGDEVQTSCWDQNEKIEKWLKEHDMTSAQLQQYFWEQMSEQVFPALKHNKTVGVWLADNFQIDTSKLPKGSFVNVYQSVNTMNASTAAGNPSVLSGPWYLDQENPGGCHEYALEEIWTCFYKVDPIVEGMSEAQKQLVLGGEVCMWGEGVNSKNFDGRTWDRTAAVAERLWSPEGTTAAGNNTEARLSEHICRMNQRGVYASPIIPSFCESDLED